MGQQIEKTNIMTEKIAQISIDEAIDVVKDSLIQAKLIEFRNGCNKNDNVTVEELENQFEIIVSHASFMDKKGNVFSGGAEQYLLHKKTGVINMGWHEHPMQIPGNLDTLELRK
jgi:hypothetical protein